MTLYFFVDTYFHSSTQCTTSYNGHYLLTYNATQAVSNNPKTILKNIEKITAAIYLKVRNIGNSIESCNKEIDIKMLFS